MRLRIVIGVLATAVVGVGSLDLVQHYDIHTGPAILLSLLRAAPLLLMLRRPVLAWCATLAATLLTAALAHPVSASEPWPWAVSSVLAALPVLVVLGARLDHPQPSALIAVPRLAELQVWHIELVLVWLSVLAAGAVPLWIAPERGRWSALIVALVLAAGALVLGHLLRDRTEAREQLGEQVAVADTERAGREVLQERARLARELHDVIAHGLSEVTVRADSAPHRLPDVSPAVAAEFDAIAEAARSALVELRQVLGVLRDPAAGAETAPLPGLAELPALAGDHPLTVEADPGRVPSAVQLAAYRVVQEALSNVRRHAPGVLAQVSVQVEAEQLCVSVTNPASQTADPAPGHGYGLAGMRERAAIVGGALDAGPQPGGGWRVEAVLPLKQEDA